MKSCISCFRQYDDQLEVCPCCGFVEGNEAREVGLLPSGTLLANRYVIGEKIGSGGLGIVYRAWDRKQETVVAVKELFSSRLVNRAPGTKEVVILPKREEEYKYRKERFLEEAQYMEKFRDHPNIITVFDFFQENGTAYIVREYMDGIRLDEYLKLKNGIIDREFALYITNEVGKALMALHKESIVHKDVAPDNIFLYMGQEKKIKLCDFGAARLGNAQSPVVDIVLKVGYSPKEQYVHDGNIGPWSDVYALGATLYVMLTGIKPEESTNRAQEDTVVPPMVYDSSISENLSNAIMKALAVDISLRYKSVQEFLDAIKESQEGNHVGSHKTREAIFLPQGTVLANRYIIGEGIGSGGFGIVYRAWDRKQGRVVNVKEFFCSHVMNRVPGEKEVIILSKAVEEYKYRIERFLAEESLLEKFNDHPNIVNRLESFKENGTAYIVIEHMDGIRLDEYIKQNNGKIDKEFALFITNEVGNALIALHKENIIHKDVAPDNIFICTGDEVKVKLCDFGAAKSANAQEQVIDIILKVGYSPKEQYVPHGNIGPWSDVYALGVMLYVMLTGIRPEESTNRAINDTVVPPMEYDPSISENLSNAIMRAMAVDIPLRFKSVQEFLDAINEDQKVLSVRAEKKRRTVKLVLGISIGVLILVAVGALVAGLF